MSIGIGFVRTVCVIEIDFRFASEALDPAAIWKGKYCRIYKYRGKQKNNANVAMKN